MKTLRYLLIISTMGLPFEVNLGQIPVEDTFAPKEQYKVHREYDENGNLMEYDSTAITTWSYSSTDQNPDSIPDYWSYTPALADSSNNEFKRSRHYGFRFPGDALDEWPQFDLGIELRDADSLIKGFDYYFSLSPGDTIDQSIDPYFDLYGQFPPMHPDIDAYIQDMQRLIDDMINKHEGLFRQYNDEEIPSLPPDNPDPESIPEPPVPGPVPQNYSGPVIKI